MKRSQHIICHFCGPDGEISKHIFSKKNHKLRYLLEEIYVYRETYNALRFGVFNGDELQLPHNYTPSLKPFCSYGVDLENEDLRLDYQRDGSISRDLKGSGEEKFDEEIDGSITGLMNGSGKELFDDELDLIEGGRRDIFGSLQKDSYVTLEEMDVPKELDEDS